MATFPHLVLSGTFETVPSLTGAMAFPKPQLTDGWQLETREITPDGHGAAVGGGAKIQFPVRRFVGSGGVLVGVPQYAIAGVVPIWYGVGAYGHVTSSVLSVLTVGGWTGAGTVHDNSRAHFIPWVPPKTYSFTGSGAALLGGEATRVLASKNYQPTGGMLFGGHALLGVTPASVVDLFKPVISGRAIAYPRSAVSFKLPGIAGQGTYSPQRVVFKKPIIKGAVGYNARGGVTLKRPRITGKAADGNRIVLPLPAITATGDVYRHGKGTITFNLPTLGGVMAVAELMHATVVFAKPVVEGAAASLAPGQGAITFRHGRVAASVSTVPDGVRFVKPKIAAQLFNPVAFKAKVRFTAPRVAGAGAGVSGTGAVSFKRLFVRASVSRPFEAAATVTFRRPKVTAILLTAKPVIGAVSLFKPKLSTRMVVGLDGEGAVYFGRMAVLGVVGEPAPSYRAYAVNLTTGAVSELPGYGFESMSGMWAVGAANIEHLEGFTDDTLPILARAVGGTTEHGTPALKRAMALYLKSTFHPETKSDLRAVVEADGVERVYRTPIGFGAGVSTRRAQLGRGVMASSWRYGFEVEYQDNFAVVSFTPDATVTSRGV